jgi:hypothetical protein
MQSTGRVRVFSGAAAGAGSGVVLLEFLGHQLYDALGLAAASRLGYSIAPVGDWNADGFGDLALGAPADHRIDPDATLPLATWSGQFSAITTGA